MACESQLPVALYSQLKALHPGWKVVDETSLVETDRQRFRRDHPGQCPSLAKGQFFGPSEAGIAVLLTKLEGDSRWLLLVAGRAAPGVSDWTLIVLEGPWKTNVADVPVIFADRPGIYKDVWGDRKIRARNSVLRLVNYDTSDVIFAWVSGKFEKLWLLD